MAAKTQNSIPGCKENGKDDKSDEDIDLEAILNGAILADKEVFKSKKGKEIKLTPVIVDFRRIIQSKCEVQVVPGVSIFVYKCMQSPHVQIGDWRYLFIQIDNNELLHAVVGLYDVSLTEMTPDVLYNTVCEKWARTIILLRDTKGKQ